MSEWYLTKSTQFLVRPLGLMRKTEFFNQGGCEIRRDCGFINAYIADKNHVNALECPIYLLFKPKYSIIWQNFLEKEYETGLLIEDYSYEGGYVVLLYEFPEEFRDDYRLVLAGKYSQTSKRYKEVFPNKGLDGQPTVQNLVLNKDAILKKHREETLGVELDDDAELWSVMYMDEETLDIENLKT